MLRPVRDSDAVPLAAAFEDDPGLAWLIGFPEVPTVESFRYFWKRNDGTRESLLRALAEPDGDDPVGVISLYGLDREHRRCELGIWLIPAGRGRGVATEAMRLLCGWAFASMELQRIALRTLPSNEPMLRLAERVGFAYEGVLRHYTYERGRPEDSAVCSLLPGELTA